MNISSCLSKTYQHILPALRLVLVAIATGTVAQSVQAATQIPPTASLQQTSSGEAINTSADTAANHDIPDMSAFMAISPQIKTILDTRIAPIRKKNDQIIALHQLFYSEQNFGIRYDNSYTKTAQEVFDSRSGNCLSLSALYISAARYLGLNAHFQLVNLPNLWDSNQNFNIYLGHVNVIVSTPGNTATVEFSDTYTTEQSSHFKSKKISDAEALARFYNNRGAELLGKQDIDTAIILLQKAAETYPTLADSWVNMGVAYKMRKDYQNAESAYLTAQKIDGNNLSASNNLYALYQEIGATEKADKLSARIHQHQLKNPYFQVQIGQQQFARADYAGALTHFKNALKLQPKTSDFYRLIGQTYFKLGRLDLSEDALQKSIEYSNNTQQTVLAEQKLAALKKIMAKT